MSRFTSVVSNHWPGYDNLKKWFIFGDSYSAVGYGPGSPAPTEAEPIGVPFPGRTWTEGGPKNMGDATNPNWVGHLVTSRLKDSKKLLVYDYAVGGHLMSGLKEQIKDRFLTNAGKKPDWAPCEAEDSLFITWIGINDCAYRAEHEEDIKKLFALQETLYVNGARNFLLIDIPPIHQSPAFFGELAAEPRRISSYFNWNDELHKGTEAFHAKHPDATLLMYSSWNIFKKVTENPDEFGFSTADLKKAGGKLWMDYLHPTSRMHAILAEHLDVFLKKYQEDTRSEDTKVKGTKIEYSKAEDSKVEDTKVEDTRVEDTKIEDTKAEDTSVEDRKAEDTKVEDRNVEDTKVEDTKVEDTKEDTKVEDTKMEDSKTEDSKTEDSKVEDSKAEDSNVEDRKAEETKAEDSKAEDSKVEKTKVEDSKAEDTKDDTKVEDSKTEDSKVEDSNVEDRKAEETKLEGTKVEETKTEETNVEEPDVETKVETKVEETKVEETKVEETKVEETKVEETKVEETKAEETKVEDTKSEDTKADDA